MAASLDDVLASAHALLDAGSFADFAPTGLQVRGTRTRVRTIATSVSSTLDAFTRAHELGADLLLVHHGLFWKGTPQVIDGVMRGRLHALLNSGITLAAYHLPLDAHRGLGNNALLARGLGLEVTEDQFAVHGGRAIGLVAEPAAPIALAELASRVRALAGGREPLLLGATDVIVRRLAICSGGAAGNLEDAAAIGCEALLTGEPREESAAIGRELGVALIAAGHHATETFGIRALGEHLAREHGLVHAFLDADNPV